jgi:glutamyl-tRNA synthetase
MIEMFDIGNVGRSASVFNPDKLNWLNAHYIKTGDPERLADLLLPHISSRGASTLNGPDLLAVVRSLQERAQTLEEMAERALFYYQAPQSYDEAALAKFDKAHLAAVYSAVAAGLSGSGAASAAEFDQIFKDLCTDNGWKMPQVGQPTRIALSGGTQAPGIGEIIEALGVEEAVRRINSAREHVAA